MVFRGNSVKYTDPTGHILHIVTGAVVGAAGNLLWQTGSQLYHQYQSKKSMDFSKLTVDWGQVAGAGLRGAIVAGSAGLGAAYLGSSVAVGALSTSVGRGNSKYQYA